jgi:uncharacterized protein Yka (UPF0111/DUF47 family)
MANARKSMNHMAGVFGRWGAVTVGAAGAAGTAFIKMRMSAVDNLAKTADKLGVTTEALAGFRHAAELSGVSSQQFDKALQNMGVQVANAAKGTGLAVRALDDLGLNAQALTKLPLDQQMLEVAKAMEGVETQSERVRIAYELFGARGVGVLNMMKNGADAMQSMAKEADTLGIALNRVDAAKIEQANDDITRAKGVFEGFGNQIAVELSPLISELATNFYQSALDANEAGSVGSRVAQALVNGFGHVANAVKGVQIAVKGIQFVFAKMAQFALTAMSHLTKSFDYLIDAYNKLADVFDWEKITTTPSTEFAALADSFGRVAEDIKGQITEALNAPLPSDVIKQFYDEVQTKARETAEVVAASSPANVIAQSQAETPAVTQLSEFQKAQMEGAEKLKQFEKKTAGEKTQFMLGELDTQLAGISKHNKKLFALQKAVQIAQAIMNTYTGATKAMASYPPPINFAMAALTVANGMAQVAQIRAQSFDGGGFTGYGARAGGLDNKGGKLALVHPNETIIDHTKKSKEQEQYQKAYSRMTEKMTDAYQPFDKIEINPKPVSPVRQTKNPLKMVKDYPSFEGGGFTGYGARTGGIDQKGGFPAILHPNETIVDHTKGQQSQGITIINNVDATGGGADVDQRIRVAMEVTSQQTVMQVQDLIRRQRLA